MGILDWAIVLIPTIAVLAIALYTTKYVKGVVDFLSAGRLCGRYVLLAGGMANGLTVLTLVMLTEIYYSTGFSVHIWTALTVPISMALVLFGFCTYRLRETKAQSFGQFLEMRYESKSLRVFASTLRTTAEVAAHAVMPAVAGRFFLYLLGFPQYISICGVQCSVFLLTMSVCMFMALFIICCGGTLTITITDAIQGMIVLPLIVLFTIYLLVKFNWTTEIAPVLMDRVPGESFINPYDVLQVREFNLLMILQSIAVLILHRGSWFAGGANSSAKNPHEQKMAGIMGQWRAICNPLLYTLISLAVLVVMNHEHFSEQARETRCELSAQVACDVIKDKEIQAKLIEKLNALPAQKHIIGVDKPLSRAENLETAYINTARETLAEIAPDNAPYLTQQFKTVYHQMMMAVTLRRLLSPGMMGLLCLLAVMSMIAVDDSFIFSSVTTIVQDMILPFFKKAPSTRLHLMLFRMIAIFVGALSVAISFYMAQLDFLQLFITVILSTWLGGCGPMIIFGLYGRFATRAAAWASLLSGMFLSLFFIFMQRGWANIVYPFLARNNWVEPVGNALEKISAPLNPIIVWEMNPEKFPINSYESYLFTMIFTLLLFLAVSWLTTRNDYNIERLLHRGIYNTDGVVPPKFDFSFGKLLQTFSGVSSEYTLGDKAIAYSVVFYSYVYQFGLCFLAMVIWNAVSPWPIKWWSNYFLVINIITPTIAIAVTSVWFGIGGFLGIIDLFKSLKNRTGDDLDNGMVVNGVSLADQAKFKKIEEEEKAGNK